MVGSTTLKLKICCFAVVNEMYHRPSYQASDILGEIATVSTGNKRLISRIYKELSKNSFKELLKNRRTGGDPIHRKGKLN